MSMSIINVNEEYDIYSDSVKIHDKLPSKVYTLDFNKMRGFYLTEYFPLVTEEKVYGVHNTKIEKVMKSFELFERSLGIILSGDKGIGKSLFTRMLSNKCIENNIPVILISKYYPNLSNFINKIDQEVMLLFDEFDKTFGEVQQSDGNASPQSELLSLFDGTGNGKKLFVITCNKLNKLNEYLINRPGRFHYHFRFDYPTAEEIRVYLTDKLDKKYYKEIEKVISFSGRTDLNYDCLRSIAFEINLGIPFRDAIKDLNILNINSDDFYKIEIYFEDGIYLTTNRTLNLNDEHYRQSIWFSTIEDVNSSFSVFFNIDDCEFSNNELKYIIDGSKIEKIVSRDECKDELVEIYKNKTIKYMTLTREIKKDKYHYYIK